MDSYAKAVMTVIAGALVVISFRLGEPKTVQAGVFDGSPTIGDMRRVVKIENKIEKQRAIQDLMDKVPLVRVQGGFIDAQ